MKPTVHPQDVFIIRNKDDAKMRSVRPPKVFKLKNGKEFTSYNAAYVIGALTMQPLRPQKGNADPTQLPHVEMRRIKGDGPDSRTFPVSTLFLRSEVIPLTEELEVG